MTAAPELFVTVTDPGADADADAGLDAARHLLERRGLPDRHDEAWHYASFDRILPRVESATPAPPAGADAVADDEVDRLAGRHSPLRLVLVDGALVTDPATLPAVAGLRIGRASQLAAAPTAFHEVVDGFHARNRLAGDDPLVVAVAAGATVDDPVHLVHLAAGGGTATIAHPRVVVRAGAGSRVTIIETFVGRPGPSVTNAVTELALDDRATVTHRRLQMVPADATHLGHTLVHQAEGSRYRLDALDFGADVARHDIRVVLTGGDVETELAGLARPRGDQHHDTAITVDHRGHHGRSSQRFKAIADDRGRSSFIGHIVVRPGTVANHATQSSRNLVLAPTARADARPWLEILADDVACTHGATVGQLDEEALFYLRSRGIPEPEARRLLVEAFANDVLAAIEGPASLRDQLTAVLTGPVEVPAEVPADGSPDRPLDGDVRSAGDDAPVEAATNGARR